LSANTAQSLNSRWTTFTGADADTIFHRQHKYFTVTYFTRFPSAAGETLYLYRPGSSVSTLGVLS
jgi:hypothetical protein